MYLVNWHFLALAKFWDKFLFQYDVKCSFYFADKQSNTLFFTMSIFIPLCACCVCSMWQMNIECSKSCIRSENKYKVYCRHRVLSTKLSYTIRTNGRHIHMALFIRQTSHKNKNVCNEATFFQYLFTLNVTELNLRTKLLWWHQANLRLLSFVQLKEINLYREELTCHVSYITLHRIMGSNSRADVRRPQQECACYLRRKGHEQRES